MFGKKRAARPAPGRFDDSFLIYMVRDFALLLALVATLELGIRFATVLYHFRNDGQIETESIADALARDVRSIMMNSGGPVAAHTVYPILKKYNQDLGYAISVVPSAKTIESIESNFGFTPKGLPQEWPSGTHHSASVDLHAEEFCLQCHTASSIGDVLGAVTVRRYLSTDMSAWWHEVRLAGLMGLSKVFLHTILLYFLLRARMEPLLSLAQSVSRLARAGSDLSFRAPVKSADEFGALADNLNRFLDRVSGVIEDLRSVLVKLDDVNRTLQKNQAQIGRGAQAIAGEFDAMRDGFVRMRREKPKLGPEWIEALDVVFGALSAMEGAAGDPELRTRCSRLKERMTVIAAHLENVDRAADAAEDRLAGLASGLADFRATVDEMAVLEERMHAIAEQGQTLVRRLLPEEAPAAG
jgi:methyl-accepting chemotaxis protein